MAYFVANWKMHKTCAEAESFVSELKKAPLTHDETIIIAAPFTLLYPMSKWLADTNIHLSAQNMFFEKQGAFTGEISPIHLLDLGVSHVIVGHSERRKFFHEDNLLISKKVKSAIDNNITPILCIGETKEERENGTTFEVITEQVKSNLSLLTIEEIKRVIFAYEPVWAIGTGLNATPEQANEVHSFIKDFLKKNYFKYEKDDVKILYGGSVTPANIKDLMKIPSISGVLVGGASLKIDSFLALVKYKE